MSEKVYMVWDIYDGARSGIANYAGKPHYFKCLFDDKADEYSNEFELTPINQETLKFALEQWAIYRDWEFKFHSGKETLDSHPGHGKVNTRYDELENLVWDAIKDKPSTISTRGLFQEKANQPKLPNGCLLEMEVYWN